jgi:hypothetical protein
MQRVAVETPVLIIADLIMTSVDAGFTFRRDDQGRPRSTRGAVIHVHVRVEQPARSGTSGPTPTDDLRKMRVDATSTKPVQAPALLAKVEQLLSRTR